MRQELSVLRRLLPQAALGADRLEVWLTPETCAVSDAGNGAVLAGLDIPSPPFEDWLRDTRAALTHTRDAQDLTAAEAALDRGEVDVTLGLCQDMLHRDPLNEGAVRLALRAGREGGRVAAARRIYDTFADHLRADLDEDPGAETQDLVRRLTEPSATPTALRQAATTPIQHRPGLAILPFDARGVEPGDMLADGIVEEITGALSRVHEFHVIARQSAWALKGTTLDA